MNPRVLSVLAAATAGLLLQQAAFAAGPYPPDAWPPTDPSKIVHYYVADNLLPQTNVNWTRCLNILTGSDHGTTLTACLKGYSARKGTSTYYNIADTNYTFWANENEIDVLFQVYGDLGVMQGKTNPAVAKVLRFQEGSASPTTFTPPAQYATNAFNNRWNWVLYSLTNGWFTNSVGVGCHLVGTNKPGSSSIYGGVNSGTIRMVSGNDGTFNGFTVHAVAFGQKGAFGLTNDVNVFDTPEPNDCPEPPAENLVGIDLNGTTNHMEIINSGDSTVEIEAGIGPDDDKRNALYPTFLIYGTSSTKYLMNFGITDNHLGLPCSPNDPVRVCIDFYDDPNLAGMGVSIGPEAYATDALGCAPASVYSSTWLHLLQGTGKWIRRSWVVPNVNLHGVNTSPLTGGPRLVSVNGQVRVSRVEMAVIRSTGPLAGYDPLAGCAQDPLACDGVYSDFVELDLQAGITNGLDIGTPTTEQAFVTEMSGPSGDQRLSVRADISPNYYLQFQILTNAFGPSYQDNAQLAIAVTYYDDPALVGKRLWIDAWHYWSGGSDPINAASPNIGIVLQGTGKWRDAYWEIDRIIFSGVNQGPQAAARFKCDDRIHVSRVRYAVIRKCGPTVGQNALGEYGVKSVNIVPQAGGSLHLTWPYREPQMVVQGQSVLGGAWTTFQNVPVPAVGEENVVTVSPTNSAQFFRLFRPSVP